MSISFAIVATIRGIAEGIESLCKLIKSLDVDSQHCQVSWYEYTNNCSLANFDNAQTLFRQNILTSGTSDRTQSLRGNGDGQAKSPGKATWKANHDFDVKSHHVCEDGDLIQHKSLSVTEPFALPTRKS